MSNDIVITTAKVKFPGNLADEYLALKAEIAKLAQQEKELKQRLLAIQKDVVEGNFGRVTISHVAGGWKPDYKTAAEECLSAKRLEKYKRWQGESVRFNVKARVADNKAA